MSWIRANLTYANVVSSIALFGFLAGGGAYAASKLGSDDIAKNAITSKHVKKKAVKTADIANRAVTDRKLAEGAGGPTAWGLVESDGDFVPSRSKGLEASDVTNGNVYCLRFTETPETLVMSAETDTPGFATATTDPTHLNTNCGVVLPSANALVLTIGANGVGAPRTFFVTAN